LGSKSVKGSSDYVRHTVELPRPTKRIISICTDAVMMPLALWAALSLKAGASAFNLTDWAAYVAVVAVSTPIFVRLGLYRAVIRFLGHQAVFAVAFAVALSGVLLGILGMVFDIRALSWSTVTIYSCLALLYVAGSRFVVRYYRPWQGSRSTARAMPVPGCRPCCRPRARSIRWSSSTTTKASMGAW
jgi:FlaA1/EpsC-like NDP-sugar epimerase